MSAETSPWTIGAIMSAIAVAVSWLGQSVMGGWKARGVVADIDKKIADQAVALKDEIRGDHDELSRSAGEAVAAVRQKIALTDKEITEMALWNRDNFVRQPHFDQTIAGINRTLEMLAGEMRAGFKDLGNKIDDKRQERKT